MKRVYVIRHAQAVGKDLSIPDFERSLVPKGVKDSRKAGKKLAQSEPQSYQMLSSPANRALETAHLVAKELGNPVEQIVLKEEIYDSVEGSSFVDIVRGVSDDFTTVMLVGHEPTLSEFIRSLDGSFQQPFVKGGVIGIEFDNDSWSELRPGSGTIFYNFAPVSKDERRRKEKHLTREIEQTISDAIVATVSQYDTDAPGRMKKVVKTAGKEVARRLVKVVGSKRLLQRHPVASRANKNEKNETTEAPEQTTASEPSHPDTESVD